MQILSILVVIFFLVIIFIKVPLMAMGFRFMVVRPLMCFLVLISVPFALTVDFRSIVENNHRVADWNDQQCVSSRVIAQNVFIAKDGNDLVGTAFLLENGYVVTNQHVSEVLHAPMFETVTGQSYRGTLIYRADPISGSDIAVYRVADLGGMPGLKLGTAEPEAGDQLMTVGQFGRRDPFYVSVLNVYDNGLRGSNVEAPMGWQTTVMLMPAMAVRSLLFGSGDQSTTVTETTANGDIGPGSSGSPAVNCAGEVVGVAYAIRGFYLHPDEQTNYLVSLEALSTELVHASWADKGNTSAQPVS